MEPSERFGSRRKMKPDASVAATVAVLSNDDLLGQFLIRLPDLPSLASAALVSKLWRRVASDPAVLRRFNLSRRPPLVGVIFSDRGDMPFPSRCPKLRFVPSHGGNPRLAAAAEAGDFLFEHLPDGSDRAAAAGAARRREDKWRLRSCDGGLLLLTRGGDSRDLAVYDPFARTAVFFPPPPDALPLRKWWHVVSLAFVVDESDGSFRVIAAHFSHELEAAIFCSRTREWAAVATDGLEFETCEHGDGLRAGRFAYWRSETKKVPYSIWDDAIYIGGEDILVLDTGTMEWSVIAAPFAVGESYCVADIAEHGGLCLVSSKEQLLHIWVRENDDEKWVIKKEVSLLKEFGFLKNIRRAEWMKRVRPLAARGDYVLMEFWSIRKSHSYLLLLNLKTMKLDMFRNDSTQPYRGPAFPFFMSSESPLLSLDKQRTLDVQGA